MRQASSDRKTEFVGSTVCSVFVHLTLRQADGCEISEGERRRSEPSSQIASIKHQSSITGCGLDGVGLRLRKPRISSKSAGRNDLGERRENIARTFVGPSRDYMGKR